MASQENDNAADEAVDFVFDRLASMLGLADWQVVEGSEDWGGDVAATLHRLLIDAGIIDEETGAVATLGNDVTDLPAYDAGLLGDGGGGDVEWWHDYIRMELERAHDFYASHVVSA